MGKSVKYTGGTDSYYPCSDPKSLTCDELYEVTYERDRGFQTDYTLKGMSGEFNSCWFTDEPRVHQPGYFAFSHSKPVIGKSLHCYKVVFENTSIRTESWITTRVIDYLLICPDVYSVQTQNSIYFVKIDA